MGPREQLAAFGTFAAGFIARPLGGIVFGHFGDRLGRKKMLVVTMLTMGIATALIGLLPTYDSIGIWAPILLTVLRISQGLAVGGEWGGASVMVVEYSPNERRGFFGSIPQAGISVGLLMSSSIFFLFTLLPEEQFLAWGWRVPFLFSLILIVVGLYIRLNVMETPSFRRVRETQSQHRIPLVSTLRTHPKNLLLVMGMRICENAFAYIAITFVLSYATDQLDMPRGPVLGATLAAAGLALVTWPAAGALSDRFGRRRTFMAGAVAAILAAFPFFWLLNTNSMTYVWLAIILGWAIISGLMTGIVPAFYSELFDARIRYTGASIGYQIGALLGGGIAPAVCTALIIWSGGSSWPVSVYIIVIALISLATAYLAEETSGRELAS